MIFVNICFNVDGYLFIYCIMDFDMDFLVWSMVDYMEMICKRVDLFGLRKVCWCFGEFGGYGIKGFFFEIV